MREKPLLPGVLETAHWVAAYRALESERERPLFQDPWAGELAGETGKAIVEALNEPALGHALAVRTKIIDDLVMQCVRAFGAKTVLNLAAGFDTRPYRLALPATLQWVDADLPRLLEQKQAVMHAVPPVCKVATHAVDLADEAERKRLFDTYARDDVLVLTEGLLLYLHPPQVEALAVDLQPFRWWILDVASPAGVEVLKQRMAERLGELAFEMPFASSNGPHFFTRLGWDLQGFYGSLEAAIHLGREEALPPQARAHIDSLIHQNRMFKQSGVVLLERKGRS